MRIQSSRRQRLMLALLLMLLLLAACAEEGAEPTRQEADSPPVAEYEPEYREESCPFKVKRSEKKYIQCGYLTVPEDRSQPDGPMVELAVAIVRTKSKNPQPAPIVYLDGGPGGSALAHVDEWLDYPMRDEHDIILLDQRGMGFSQPSLNCIEIELQEESTQAATVKAARACYKRLKEEGVDFAHYTSADSAADVADLRVALGYDEWNVLGISYGTRLGLTLMRDHPEGIRSVILDSVYPPEIDAYTEEPVHHALVIQGMLATCAEDADCNEAFPDLEARFYELLGQLRDEPVEFDDGTVLDDEYVTDVLISSLYDRSLIGSLPLAIDGVYNGEYDAFFALEGGDEGGGGRAARRDDDIEPDLADSEGAFYNIECHEEMPFGDLAAAREEMKAFPRALARPLMESVEETHKVCKIWQTGPVDPIERELVESDLPTLILVGELDPTTPAVWGRSAAEGLSNHFYFEVPQGGHDQIDSDECPMNVALAFLDDPSEEPDGSCIAEMEFYFELP